MLTKNEIKYIQSLFHRKQRDEERLFVAEGPKLAAELLQVQHIIKHLYATARWIKDNPGVQVPFTEISDIELSRISNLQTPNEVVIIAHQPTVAKEITLRNRLTIMLDGIQDPGNMGTILRIADWFGVQQIICSDDCVEIYNPKVVQATMGSILRVNCWYKDLSNWEKDEDIPVFGALLKGKNIYTVGKVQEGLVVIGNEAKGICEPLLSKITDPVTIPKAGGANRSMRPLLQGS